MQCRKIWLLIILLSMMFTGYGSAGIYQYTDENGVTRYTDTKPKDDSENVKEIDGIGDFSGFRPNTEGLPDLSEELYTLYKPVGKIEEATLATVTIRSTIGEGSGFFISNVGHIITNRHVIRGDEHKIEYVEKRHKAIDKQIEQGDDHFEHEEKKLEAAKKHLEEMRDYIDSLPKGPRKDTLEKQYKNKFDYYNYRNKNYKAQLDEYESKKKEYRHKKQDYKSKVALAGISSHFTVILKNGTELYAYLIRASRDYDLALLKVDGYQTPYISPSDSYDLRQGNTVFAIGSPVQQRDTVSRGVVSGFEQYYIKTDAKIYPGNSGGPLINHEGLVVGINTLKKLTRGYEGLGFAITIETALKEFNSDIR